MGKSSSPFHPPAVPLQPPFQPNVPPSLPTPSLSDATQLQVRINALEARVQALEAIFTKNAAGLTINSNGNITLAASKDVFIVAERDLGCDIGGNASLAIAKCMTTDVGDDQTTHVGNHYHLDCGAAKIDILKVGTVDIIGGKISVKGTGEVTIKGSKVLQN
jgi:hypothetical protein